MQPYCRLASLLEALRQNTEGSLIDRIGIAPPPMMHSGIIQAREFDDPPGLHEKTEYLLREWVNLYHSPAAGLDSTKAFSSFVAQVCIISVMFFGCVMMIPCVDGHQQFWCHCGSSLQAVDFCVM